MLIGTNMHEVLQKTEEFHLTHWHIFIGEDHTRNLSSLISVVHLFWKWYKSNLKKTFFISQLNPYLWPKWRRSVLTAQQAPTEAGLLTGAVSARWQRLKNRYVAPRSSLLLSPLQVTDSSWLFTAVSPLTVNWNEVSRLIWECIEFKRLFYNELVLIIKYRIRWSGTMMLIINILMRIMKLYSSQFHDTTLTFTCFFFFLRIISYFVFPSLSTVTHCVIFSFPFHIHLGWITDKSFC